MQFVITAYDGVGLLERRMEVRPRHMEGMARMVERMNVVLLDREFVQKV